MLFGAIQFAVACVVMFMALTGGVPMPPETHGTAMYTIPAELWASIVMAQAIGAWLGAHLNRLRILVVAGALGVAVYMPLGAMMLDSPFGFIPSLFTLGFGFAHLVLAFGSMLDLLGLRLVREPSLLRLVANGITLALAAMVSVAILIVADLPIVIVFLAASAFYTLGGDGGRPN